MKPQPIYSISNLDETEKKEETESRSQRYELSRIFQKSDSISYKIVIDIS